MIETAVEQPKPRRVTFWQRHEVRSAQRCLDCWASWVKSTMARCDPPRWDALFPSGLKIIFGVVDPRTGCPDWSRPGGLDRSDPTSFGVLVREPNADPKILGRVRLVAWEVHHAIDADWHDVLLRLYPRTGPYSTRHDDQDRDIHATYRRHLRESGLRHSQRMAPERLAILAIVSSMIDASSDWPDIAAKQRARVEEHLKQLAARSGKLSARHDGRSCGIESKNCQ